MKSMKLKDLKEAKQHIKALVKLHDKYPDAVPNGILLGNLNQEVALKQAIEAEQER